MSHVQEAGYRGVAVGVVDSGREIIAGERMDGMAARYFRSGHRKAYTVENGDPMTLGALTGNLFTPSRIFGAGDRETAEGLMPHTERCLANTSALLASATLDWRDVSQLVTYGSSPNFRGPVAAALQQISHGGSQAPLDFLETDPDRGTLLPRLQLLGLSTSEAVL